MIFLIIVSFARHTHTGTTTGAVKNNLAGDFLTREMYRYYQQKDVQIHPRYCLQKREVKEGQFEVSVLDFPGITKSYHEYMIHVLSLPPCCYLLKLPQDIVRDIKESTLSISESAFDKECVNILPIPARANYFLPSVNANIPSVQYELPDGKMLEVGTERFWLGEYLFSPETAEFFEKYVACNFKQDAHSAM